MGALDPVSWETIEAVFGPPAPDVRAAVDRLADDVRDEEPYVAVKTIHDALSESGASSIPDQGEVFLVAYLLEREGVVAFDDGLPSVRDRRPDDDRLRELFWDRHRTMWWIGVRLGVHWALVRYWLWEADVPLRERNFSPESMERIRAYRSGNG